jgi:peptidyl-prolyl cis-trans isomerase D
MLDGLRKIGRTWFGKLLGAFLIVGLAGFGISNVIFDIGSNAVAQVGGEDITSQEFARAYQTDINRMSQQFGTSLTGEQAVAMGIPSSTLNRLAAEAAIDQLGKQLGLGVSESRLGLMLRNDPSFAGTLGNFQRENFRLALQQMGMTEAEYFELQTRAARRNQLFAALLADSAVPQAAQELLTRYGTDTRTLDYFVLSAENMLPPTEPTDEQLTAYLTENQADYRTEETRAVDVLVLSPDTLAQSIEVTEEEIAAEYERTRAQRVNLERRNIQQVALATPEQKTAFEQGQAAGRSFDEILAELGLTPTDLGMLAQSEVTDQSLATAAFGLAAPGAFTIIPGIGGERVVSVAAIEAGGEIPLAEASDQIRQSLALQRARNQYVDVLDQVEELRAARTSLADIASRFNLQLASIDLTVSGAELGAAPGIAEENRARVASAVFDAEQGDIAPAVMISSNNNIWFDIKSIEPARDQTLDEVREQLVADWTAEQNENALVAETERVLADLDAGKPFAEVAASVNQFPVLSQPMTRNGDGSDVLDQRVGADAFNGGIGHYGAVENSAGDTVVYQVVDVTPSDATPSDQERNTVADSTRNSLYGDFVTGLRDQSRMTINRQTFEQLVNPAISQ